MYTNVYYNFDKNHIHIWDDEYGYIKKKFQNYAFVRDNNGDFYSLDGKKLSKVHDVHNYDPKDLYEQDVNPEIRYIIDNYKSSEPSKQHILYFDIETEVGDKGFPDPAHARNKLTSTTFYSSISKKYTCFVLDPEHLVTNIDSENLSIQSIDNEEELLLHIIKTFKKSKGTIVTGWNINGFDIPYLTRRIERVLGQQFIKELSPVNLCRSREDKYNGVSWQFAGFSLLDYMNIYRKFTYSEKASYALNNIAEEELKEQKLQYDGTLDELYNSDRNKFVEYNIHDVELIVKLEKKLKYMDIAVALAHVGHIPYERVFSSKQLVDGAVIHGMREFNIVAPSVQENDTEDLVGAYVKPPQTGLWKWIYDLDFSSLYPSIILTLNISPETKVGRIKGWNINEVGDYEFKFLDKFYKKDSILEFCKAQNFCISPNGVVYNSAKRGIIPKVVEGWLDKRKEYKDLMKKYGKEKNQEKEDQYDSLQMAFKILANSLYGVTASPYWRFYDIENAKTITTTGQSALKFAIEKANEFYNSILKTDKKDYVIYCDTDSLFMSADEIIDKLYKEKIKGENSYILYTKKIASVTQDYINDKLYDFAKNILKINIDLYPHKLNVKQELVAKSGLFLSKKHYGLYIIDKEGIPKDEIYVKGLEIVRSSYPKMFQKLLKTILRKILNGDDKDSIDQFILSIKDMIIQGELELIANPTGINGLKKYSYKNGSFTKGTPIHIKAALRYNHWLKENKLQKKYNKIPDKSKIKWLYLVEDIAFMPVIGFPDTGIPKKLKDYIKDKVDYNTIYEKQIMKKIQQYYEAMEWSLPIDNKNTLNDFFE